MTPDELNTSVLAYLDVHAPELATAIRQRLADHQQALADLEARLFLETGASDA